MLGVEAARRRLVVTGLLDAHLKPVFFWNRWPRNRCIGAATNKPRARHRLRRRALHFLGPELEPLAVWCPCDCVVAWATPQRPSAVHNANWWHFDCVSGVFGPNFGVSPRAAPQKQ